MICIFLVDNLNFVVNDLHILGFSNPHQRTSIRVIKQDMIEYELEVLLA